MAAAQNEIKADVAHEELQLETVATAGQDKHLEHTVFETAFVGLSRKQALLTFRKATLYCCLAAFGALFDGYQYSVPGSIIANQGFILQFGSVTNAATGAISLNPQYVSAWGGLTFASQIIGQHTTSFVADNYGRRFAFYGLSAVFIIATIMEMLATNWQVWLASKLFVGWGQGMAPTIILVYISEVAPAQIRGTLLCLYALAFALGQLISAIALQILNVTTPLRWRNAVYSMWVLHGLFLIAIVFIPESPWFYVRHGEREKAKRILQKLYSGIQGYDVEREYDVMAREVEEERARAAVKTEYVEVFRGTNLKRLLATVFALNMLPFAGISVIFTYTTYFLQQAGIQQPFQASCIIYCILIASVAASFYTIELFGRRTLILVGGVSLFLVNIALGITGVVPRTDAVLNVTLAFICIWVFIYASCFAGTGWTLAAEIATPRLRAKTTALAYSTYTLVGLIFSVTVPLMLATTGPGAANWGVKTLFMYAGLMAIGTVMNFIFLPETKGRTFSELDEMYEARIPPRRMKNYKTRVEQIGEKQHGR